MRKGETGRWADVRLKHTVVKITEYDVATGDYVMIRVNKIVHDLVGGAYNNAEF